MTSNQTKAVCLAEAKALKGDLLAMEFLARRFFEGRGADQSFPKCFFWSSIALKGGISYLTSLNEFALNKLSDEEKLCADEDLQGWFDNLAIEVKPARQTA